MEADLRICLSHIPHCWKSRVTAQCINSLHGWKSVYPDHLTSDDASLSKSKLFSKEDDFK